MNEIELIALWVLAIVPEEAHRAWMTLANYRLLHGLLFVEEPPWKPGRRLG